MRIKGLLKDLSMVFTSMKIRKKAINSASSEIEEDNIFIMAKKLHPGKISAVVSSIKDECRDSKRITFESDDIPMFIAGQYLTVEVCINDQYVCRPYSIISDPYEAYEKKEVEILVRDCGYGLSKYLNHDLKVGDEVLLEVGLGELVYNKYRDKKNLTLIAGGTGITPFISIIKSILRNHPDVHMSLIYGNEHFNEIPLYDELEKLKGEQLEIHHIIASDKDYKGDKGVITKEIIKKYALEDSSYFFSGSLNMYRVIEKELKELGIDMLRVRKESFPIHDISLEDGYDMSKFHKEVEIEVHQGKDVRTIKGYTDENIALILEKNGYHFHTCCRGGSCGVCRIKIMSGEFFIPKISDHRRYIDKEYNYVHACSTYPYSNLVIKINIQ